MKVRELELCEIQRWYPRFKSVSLKTIIHALPNPFIAYLQEDGLFLSHDSEALPARQKSQHVDCDQDEDYHRWAEEDDETSEPESRSFPQLEAEVALSIALLGGFVFPKLNWSAPKDSAWISTRGSLRCTNFGEVCLLLKASDSLVHDLSHAFDSCDDKTSDRPAQFVLALRKWYDMRPEMEFRGFVRHGLLVGLSQREVTGFYPALLESERTLEASIFEFFIESLCGAFELEDYTFDCYVTRNGKVKLVDFNPWGAFTLPLLFTWDELDEIYTKWAEAIKEISAATDAGFGDGEGDTEGAPTCGNGDDVVSCLDFCYNTGQSAPTNADLKLKNRKKKNVLLREQGFRPELRIIRSNCHVQVNLRMGGGVPYEYVETGPGSAWDEFLHRAGEELQQQNKDMAAAGG